MMHHYNTYYMYSLITIRASFTYIFIAYSVLYYDTVLVERPSSCSALLVLMLNYGYITSLQHQLLGWVVRVILPLRHASRYEMYRLRVPRRRSWQIIWRLASGGKAEGKEGSNLTLTLESTRLVTARLHT